METESAGDRREKGLRCRAWFIFLLLGTALLSCSENAERIRMVAPDDLGGLPARQLMQTKAFSGAVDAAEIFPLADCCSSTANWALGADEVDMAWLCPDAAADLIAKDGRFEIIGPALVNSQIILVRRGVSPRRIAYSHKRSYQRTFIREHFGPDCEAVPVMPSALPYVYEKGHVDGIVIDIVKGLQLRGKPLPLSGTGREVTTYVLVVRRDFRKSIHFQGVFKALRACTAELNDRDVLMRLLIKEKRMTPETVRQIFSLGMRFVPPNK